MSLNPPNNKEGRPFGRPSKQPGFFPDMFLHNLIPEIIFFHCNSLYQHKFVLRASGDKTPSGC